MPWSPTTRIFAFNSSLSGIHSKISYEHDTCRCKWPPRWLFLFAICMITLSASVKAQTTTTTLPDGDNQNQGLPSGGIFSAGDIDSVQMASGNLHIEIPLWQVKGRGGLNFWVKLVYDNKGWDTKTQVVDHGPNGDPRYVTTYFIEPGPESNMHWSLITPESYASVNISNAIVCSPTLTLSSYLTVLVEPDGTSHALTPAANVGNSCPGHIQPFAQYSTDPTGWMKNVRKDGTRANPTRDIDDGVSSQIDGGLTDRNGNTITYVAQSSIHTDTAGRTTGNVLTYYDSSGAPQTINISYTNVSVSTNFCGNRTLGRSNYQCTEYSSSWNAPSVIRLPNGTSYTITYNQGTSGEIQSITLPSGATIDYSWTPNVGGSVLDASGKRVSERDVHDGNSTYVWKYNYSDPNQVIFTDPNNNDTTYNCAFGSSSGATLNYTTLTPCYPTDVKYYEGPYTSGAVDKEVQRTYWAPLYNAPANGIHGAEQLVSSEVTLLDGIPSSRTDYDYDSQADSLTSWGNVIDKREYMYANGAWSLARRTHTTYKHLDDPTNYGSRNLANLPSSVTVYDGGTPGTPGALTDNYSGGNVVSQTIYGYDEYSTSPLVDTSGSPAPQHDYKNYPASMPYRGNLTSVKKWNNVDGSYSTTTYTYNDLGDVLNTTDPGGHTTTYSYADAYSGPGCVSANAQAYLATSTNALNQKKSFSYYPCSGLLQSIKDPNDIANNRLGTQYFYDMQGWPTGTTFSDGGSSTITYNGYALPIVATTTTIATPDPSVVSSVHYDYLGRAVQSVLQSDPIGPVYVDTTYDGVGQVISRSNPYRSATDPTIGTSFFSFDAIGRKHKETHPDSSTLQWSYSGNQTTFADEAGNQWTRTSDALGRLTNVTEPGSLQTTYKYDVLGNLLCADQWGPGTIGQPCSSSLKHSFAYDSLSRLTSATNPETGTIGYSYDANDNLLSKTDARGVTTSYGYDALNRLTAKTSSDGSLGYTYAYDNTTEGSAGIGRLYAIFKGSSAGYGYYYDPMGRIIGQSYQVPSMNGAWQQAFDLKYDLAGSVTDFTYPDGLHLQQAWDGAGRMSSSSLVDINGATTSQSYLQSATYHPDGSPYVLTLGNGVQQTVDEDNRLQVQSMVASSPLAPFNSQPFLSHTYCYVNCPTGGAHNNGNIWGITDSLNPSLTQGFTYDSLNRINSFSLGGVLNQQYKVDSFGNMSPMAGTNPVYTFNSATNRISNLPCASVANPYDAAGNQTCDTDANGAARTYSFDAEEHVSQIAMVGGGTPFETYIYDGIGNRVSKANANGTFNEYVYFNGQPMAEKDQSGAWTDYIYADGKKIASVPTTELRIHAHGNNTVGTFTAMGFPLNRIIQPGDHLAWRQYDAGSSVDAGIYVGFTDGTTTLQQVADDHGQAAEGGGVIGSWDQRVVDLSAFAGKTANGFALMSGWQSLGRWDVWYADIALYGADGSVTQLFNGQPIPMGSLYVSDPTAQTEGQMCLEQGSSCVISSTVQPTASRTAAVHYYFSDHLGSTQMETSTGGWPVWKGQFAPFGQELDTQFTANHYKFTGKERDTESGLDYFGARYYASSQGRWISPDWADKPEAVPYSDLENPQSLNLYGYVNNNPLSKVDIDGHADGDTKERLIEALSGVVNLTLAGAKGVGVVGELVATPATVGVSGAAAVYEGLQTYSQGAAGITQIGGAISGKTDATNKAADAMIVSTSIAGTATLAATNGNLDAASQAAAAEGLVSSSVTRSIFNSVTSMADTILNIKQLLQKKHSQVIKSNTPSSLPKDKAPPMTTSYSQQVQK